MSLDLAERAGALIDLYEAARRDPDLQAAARVALDNFRTARGLEPGDLVIAASGYPKGWGPGPWHARIITIEEPEALIVFVADPGKTRILPLDVLEIPDLAALSDAYDVVEATKESTADTLKRLGVVLCSRSKTPPSEAELEIVADFALQLEAEAKRSGGRSVASSTSDN